VRLLRPLRHRDFGLLWAGMSVSIVGDGFYQVALAWQVYLLSDAPTALSIVGAAVTLPNVLFVVFAGVLSDRFERRKVLMVADALRLLAVGLMGALAVSGELALWHVVALSLVFGIGDTLFGPAFTALVPDLVPADELAAANSVDAIVRPLGLNLLGPALGGLVIAGAGAGTALLLDAASFGVSFLALALMRPHPLAAGGNRGLSTVMHEVGEGLRYVRRHTWLWGTLVAASVSLLCFMGPMRVLVPLVVKNQLHGTASDLGLVFAAGGVGAIVASMAFSQRGLPARAVVVMFVAWGLAIYAVAGFGLADALWQLAVVSFASGGLATIGQLIWVTLIGTAVPRELLGRVSSLDWMLSIGLVPVSFIATGPIAELIGVSQTLVLAGLLGGTVFLAFLLLPGMRAPSPDQQTASSSPSPS
jgi:DHA3 family tetracycline resistance protein-like MFS transporter